MNLLARISILAAVLASAGMPSASFAQEYLVGRCPKSPPDDKTADPNAWAGVPAAPPKLQGIQTDWVAPFGFVPGYCVYKPGSNARDGLIVYLHGTKFEDSVEETYDAYDPMLQWLTYQGYTVVYPDLRKDQSNWPGLAQQALRNAVDALGLFEGRSFTHALVAGHSMGALAAPVLAARWAASKRSDDPTIRAIVLHEPAGLDLWDVTGAAGRLPADTRVLIVQAESNLDGFLYGATEVWQSIDHIPLTQGSGWSKTYRKNFLRVMRDVSHGWPLPSDHNTVQAYPLTALDHWGYWRPLEAAAKEAFTGQAYWGYSAYCNDAGSAGLCNQLRYTGTWVDGKPATPMLNYGQLTAELWH